MKRITWFLAAAILVAGPALAATPKDTVVMAKQIDDIISLDPAESFEFSGSEAVGNVYERLIAYDFKDVSKLKGELAESWSVGADGKTYTFKMKKGLKFHSGNPVTAGDAAYSLQRAVILNKSPGFILTQFGFTKENVKEKIRATDDQTLVIETADAVAPTFFYYCLTATVGSVVDSKVVQGHDKGGDFGNEWLKTNSAASGPFKVVSWKASESYTLERWDGYHGTQGDSASGRRPPRARAGDPAAAPGEGRRRLRPQPDQGPAGRDQGQREHRDQAGAEGLHLLPRRSIRRTRTSPSPRCARRSSTWSTTRGSRRTSSAAASPSTRRSCRRASSARSTTSPTSSTSSQGQGAPGQGRPARTASA